MNTLDLMTEAAIDIVNPLLPNATRMAATFTFIKPLPALHQYKPAMVADAVRTYGNEVDTLIQLLDDTDQSYGLRNRIMEHSLKQGIDYLAASAYQQKMQLKQNIQGTGVSDYFANSAGSIAHHVKHHVSFQNIIDTLLHIAERPGKDIDHLTTRKIAIQTMNSIYNHAVHVFDISIDRGSIYDRLTNIALNEPNSKLREAAMIYDQLEADRQPKPAILPPESR